MDTPETLTTTDPRTVSAPDLRRASTVMVVDTTSAECDTQAAAALIDFTAPEVRGLGRRRTVQDVHELLLWCTFAWNHARQADASELLATVRKTQSEATCDLLRRTFERRLREHPASDLRVGALRTTRMPSGAVRVHVEATAASEHAAR